MRGGKWREWERGVGGGKGVRLQGGARGERRSEGLGVWRREGEMRGRGWGGWQIDGRAKTWMRLFFMSSRQRPGAVVVSATNMSCTIMRSKGCL